MLGFSRTEEALLFNATKGSAVDALVSLQSLFKEVAAGMGVSRAIYFTFNSYDWLLWGVEVESDGVAESLDGRLFVFAWLKQIRMDACGNESGFGKRAKTFSHL